MVKVFQYFEIYPVDSLSQSVSTSNLQTNQKPIDRFDGFKISSAHVIKSRRYIDQMQHTKQGLVYNMINSKGEKREAGKTVRRLKPLCERRGERNGFTLPP